jgi:alkylation response protein AidB-like acyl-CoA dehydrogenase
MNFRLNEEQVALRAGIRRFLKENLPADRPLEDTWMIGFSREFSRALGAAGWIGLTWPKRYGGRERSYLDRLIVTEELLRHGAPVVAHWFGNRQVGPALLPVAAGRLEPKIHRAFSLQSAADARRMLEGRAQISKLVLTVGPRERERSS